MVMQPKACPRICFCIGSLDRGGAERVFTVIANALSQRGYTVDFIVCTDRLSRQNELSNEMNTILFNRKRLYQAGIPLLRYLNDQEPDVVLSTLHHTNFLTTLVHHLTGCDSSLLVRIPNDLTAEDFVDGRYRDRLTQPIARLLYPQADRVICLADAMKQGMQQQFQVPPTKLSTIPNPVDLEELDERGSAFFPEHPFFKQGDPVLLSVGKLERQKNYQLLIKAFEQLTDTHPFRLLILGEGSKREELENLIQAYNLSDRIDLPGEVVNPYPYFAQADLFVLSSRWEGMPNVLLEALALGTTIVSTRCRSGPEELLKGGAIRISDTSRRRKPAGENDCNSL